MNLLSWITGRSARKPVVRRVVDQAFRTNAEIEAALARRKANRKARQDVALKGWQTRKAKS